MQLDALLFAAGRGERLRPLTERVPKAALDVCGAPLGAWGLAALRAAREGVAVNVSHLGDTVADALRPYAPDLRVLDEGPEPYGTAGTLRAYRDLFGAEIVTYNADVLADLDIAALVAAHRRLGAPMTAAVTEVDLGADLALDGEAATAFVDRRREPEHAGARFIGIAVVEQSAIDLVPPDGPRGLGEAVIAPLARRGQLAVFVHRGYALDVGTPERLEQARADVRAGRIAVPRRA